MTELVTHPTYPHCAGIVTERQGDVVVLEWQTQDGRALGAADRERLGCVFAAAELVPAGTPPTKRCTKCGQPKPYDAFAANPGHRDGRASRCRACVGQAVNERRRAEREQAAQAPPSESVTLPRDAALLRKWARHHWRLQGLTDSEVDDWAEVLWGLICDPAQVGLRAGYERLLSVQEELRR